MIYGKGKFKEQIGKGERRRKKMEENKKSRRKREAVDVMGTVSTREKQWVHAG